MAGDAEKNGAKRVGILVVAYNAASTLVDVLDRIPPDVRPRISKVLVGDDHSQDDTYGIGVDYRDRNTDLPLTVVRHERNLGYGGNQKVGYRWAIEQGLDIVVLLHGDGQYAPECMAELIGPLERDECDAVLGSRMMTRGAALRGGMPLYKYVGNRILTAWENAMAGTSLTEWHSGYRAYSVAALADIDFEANSDGFDFDTQILLQLHHAGKQIVEVPIPTYYGDEICHVNGLAYARDVALHTLRYRLQRMGFASDAAAGIGVTDDYELKTSPGSSHSRLLDWLGGREPARVLDLGCADGWLAERGRKLGHEVVGVDIEERPGIGDRTDRFVRADLDHGIPAEAGREFDIVLAADVLEHVRDPERLLREARELIAPGGVVLTSVPNFGHWYPRARVLSGRFDYDHRGILDRGHVRFFTRRSFEQLVVRAGFDVVVRDAVGTPFEVINRGGSPQRGRLVRIAEAVDRIGVAARPTVFGYQFLYELRPSSSATSASHTGV
ncbi:MAG TPA: bifunctional glycosyltransferase/class I SAM-dependent methyltransferase [Acidimicrobiales bacterium]|nr:bifunctional glycosyltransferase/class I SAM-dependent methyltransferase [Acidimicrobiales bacterium]